MEDFSALTAPLGADAPCGISVEYDPQFLALEEQALGKPEVEYGSTLTLATPPDWVRVKSLALLLAQRTRDLRIAVLLTRAELNLNGISGLVIGLKLIETLVDQQWQHVHPQLEADDNYDPRLRVNIIAALCDDQGLLRDLRMSPLVISVSLGNISIRDLDLATGELISPDGTEVHSLAAIEGAFQEVGAIALSETLAALEDALAHSRRIETLLTEKVGVEHAVDLSALPALLIRASEWIRRHLPEQAVAGESVSPGTVDSTNIGNPESSRSEIRSREDVQLMLDKMCAYFSKHEPTSPVPLLLQRARKLVDMSFIELLQDLAPDGLTQLKLVSGLRDDT